MKTKVLLTAWLFSLALSAQPQTSLEKAKNILGDHFISVEQATTAWQKVDSNISSAADIIIPYTESTLAWFQSKTTAGEGDFYLVPNLGLSDVSLGKFWDNYYGVYSWPEKTEISYRLINLKPPDSSNSTGFKELSQQMLADQGQAIPIMDYLEILATTWMVTGENFCPQFSWLVLNDEKITAGNFGNLPEDFKEELVLACSAIISGDCHEVIVTYFPKENFISGSISSRKLTLLATESNGMESMILVPLKNISCSFQEKDYFIGLCYYVLP
jgi:hypothetical protein